MTPESVMVMGQEAMRVALMLAAPLLLAALVSGLLISLIQAATQVNEQTLSFIPKILAVATTGIIAGPWMLICCWTISAPSLLTCLTSSADDYSRQQPAGSVGQPVLLATGAYHGVVRHRTDPQ